MEAKTFVEAFINTWVARYGVPEAVTTDRGRQFTSALWEGLCHNLQINHISTTAYQPQSNGLVERTHHQIKDALRARLAGNRWPEHLPWVLFGLRAAPKEDSAVSSAELVFGAPLTLPGQLLTSPETPVEDVVETLRSTQPLATRPLTYTEASSLYSERSSCMCGRAEWSRPYLPCTRDHTRSWTGGRNSSSWRSVASQRSSVWTG
jgi:hypothetical protein